MPINLASLRRWYHCLALFLLALPLIASAAGDPAGRVGRLAWMSGSVHLHRAATGESMSAMRNWPITSGDIVSTGAGARAEIEVGSVRVQVDSGSVLEFAQVDDERLQLRLLDGSVIVRLPSPESAREFELSTRDGRFRVRDAGRYRFDSDRATTAGTVYFGNLRFDTTDGSVDLAAGQRAQFWNAGRTQQQLSAPVYDEFALWSSARDRQYGSIGPARYVSPEMTGATELEEYGRWYDSPDYGAVWYPRAVAADWVPYRMGRWVWVEPWGWNWVGDEPWGFAPFHYGRWVLYRGAWGWVPGKWVARPVYAPALVAWIGTPSVGASPTVGWFPLAPREVYIPPYRSSGNHLRQVNLAHVANIGNVTAITSNPQAAVESARYANHRLPQAVTVVPADVMTQRRHVGETAFGGPERTLSGSQVQLRPPVAAQPTQSLRRQESDPRADQGRGRPEVGAASADNRGGEHGSLRQAPPVAASGVPASAPPQMMPPPFPGRAPAAARDAAVPAGGPAALSGSRDGGQQSPGRQPPQAVPVNSRLPEARPPLLEPAPAASAPGPVVFPPGEKSERSRTAAADRHGSERREPAADPRVGNSAAPVARQKERDVVPSLPIPAPATVAPTPLQPSFAAPQRSDRRPAEIATPPAIVRQERPAPRPEAPPPPSALPRPAERPAPEAVRMPPQPTLERYGATEQRRQERVPSREDPARQSVRQEVRAEPPSATPSRAVPPSGRADAVPRLDRPLHPERSQESGRPHERRGDPRDEHRQPVQDKP